MNDSNLSRRDLMLRLGQIGAGVVTLPGLLHAESLKSLEGSKVRGGGRAKSCILLYLWGGPPQQDLWDMKPNAPEGIRSEFSPVATVTPGIDFCDHLPLMAQHSDKMAIVRSLTHKSNDHVPSVYHTLTGTIDPTLAGAPRQRRRSDFPMVGSVVARFSPPGNLPATVTIPRPVGHDGVTYSGTHAGFLGPQYDPLELKPPGEVEGPPPHSLELPDGLSDRRLRNRYSILQRIENLDRRLDQVRPDSPLGLDIFRQQAVRMLTSPEAKHAFDLEREDPRLRDRYGRNEYGESFLLARRLVEAGVRLVSVVWHYIQPNGNVMNIWDAHGGPNLSCCGMLKKDYLLPPLDLAYSALLEDLSQRGLLDETIVAMYGEFGRTPKLNKFGGRDHWGSCQTAVLAGGGIQGGQLYGSSDQHAAYPRDHPVSPQDIAATIYHALGIRTDLEIRDRQGRPFRVCEGESIAALF
ncbi:DUF1501 domain-containing protein [Singulisphaera sp. Ch08]|uniref:DUF1501 domain-containing protein n=1 Tax=Singulisphaera sp. Ch08 TaxID=3120278 RepID=A0AAU7CHJ3_9BACT